MAWPRTVAWPRALVSMVTLRDCPLVRGYPGCSALGSPVPAEPAYPLGMDVYLRSPRNLQGLAAAVVLLGFVADLRAIVVLAALGLLAAYVLLFDTLRRF